MAARTRSTLRALTTLLGAAALLMTVAAPSEAGRWASRDARGDVEKWSWSPEPEPCGTDTVEPRPDDAQRDITRLVVSHQRTAVRVVIHFRDLRASTRTWLSVGIRTPGRAFEADLVQRKVGTAPRGTFYELRKRDEPSVDETDSCGYIAIVTPVGGCRGVERAFSARTDKATLTIPRSCLGDPRWVRVSTQANGLGKTFVYDQWSGPEGRRAGSWGIFGPRVRRG